MGFCSGGLGWGRWMGWGGGWAGLVLGLALLIGTLVVLSAVAAWFVRQSRQAAVRSGPMGDPLEIARGRLASGEITIEEYEGIRRTLREGR